VQLRLSVNFMPNPKPTEAQLDAIARQRLEAFVLRARRVAEHSLVKDRNYLESLAAVVLREPSTASPPDWGNVIEDPSEEALESLLARVRPILLVDETVHHAKLTSALSRLMRSTSDPAVKASIGALKRAWKEVDVSKAGGIFAYAIVAQNADADSTTQSDDVLARSWFYGDVVHAQDDLREGTQAHGIDARYFAAVPHVARVALLTLQSLELIELLRDRAGLSLDPSTFEEPVVAKQGKRFHFDAVLPRGQIHPPLHANGTVLVGWNVGFRLCLR
jgi:hypothetical protein